MQHVSCTRSSSSSIACQEVEEEEVRGLGLEADGEREDYLQCETRGCIRATLLLRLGCIRAEGHASMRRGSSRIEAAAVVRGSKKVAEHARGCRHVFSWVRSGASSGSRIGTLSACNDLKIQLCHSEMVQMKHEATNLDVIQTQHIVAAATTPQRLGAHAR